jgi:hypothetical protein
MVGRLASNCQRYAIEVDLRPEPLAYVTFVTCITSITSPIIMRTDKTVQMDSHAAATLQYIRASMDAAASLNVPGSAAIAVGVVGALATALCFVPSIAAHWIAVWLIAAVVAVSVGGGLALQQFALVGAGPILTRAPVRKLLLCWSPSLLAGAVMTAVHLSSGNQDAISGTWLMLYGCAMIGASAVTNRSIGALGIAFFACGVLALLLPEEAHVLMLGAGFGGLHLVFGLSIRRASHGSET